MSTEAIDDRTVTYPYVWRWRRWKPPGYDRYLPHVFADRFGEPCRVLVRGATMNTVGIEFASDGCTAVVSSRALHRIAASSGAASRSTGQASAER